MLRATIAVAMAFGASANVHASKVEGKVVDAKIGKPVQGAFVMAVYFESGGTWFGHSGRWCVRTEGVLTGADGSYALTGAKHMELHVIKEGLVENKSLSDRPHLGHWYETQSERATNLFVEPMVAGGRKSRWVECERPATHGDAEANIAYLKLLEKEDELRGVDARGRLVTHQAIERLEKKR